MEMFIIALGGIITTFIAQAAKTLGIKAKWLVVFIAIVASSAYVSFDLYASEPTKQAVLLFGASWYATATAFYEFIVKNFVEEN